MTQQGQAPAGSQQAWPVQVLQLPGAPALTPDAMQPLLLQSHRQQHLQQQTLLQQQRSSGPSSQPAGAVAAPDPAGPAAGSQCVGLQGVAQQAAQQQQQQQFGFLQRSLPLEQPSKQRGFTYAADIYPHTTPSSTGEPGMRAAMHQGQLVGNNASTAQHMMMLMQQQQQQRASQRMPQVSSAAQHSLLHHQQQQHPPMLSRVYLASLSAPAWLYNTASQLQPSSTAAPSNHQELSDGSRSSDMPPVQRRLQQGQPQQHQGASELLRWSLGDEVFFSIRSVMLQQQEQFVQQLYELHRLARLQQMIAPELDNISSEQQQLTQHYQQQAVQRLKQAQQQQQSSRTATSSEAASGDDHRRHEVAGDLENAATAYTSPQTAGVAAAPSKEVNTWHHQQQQQQQVQGLDPSLRLSSQQALLYQPGVVSLPVHMVLLQHLPSVIRQVVSQPVMGLNCHSLAELNPRRYCITPGTQGVANPRVLRWGDKGAWSGLAGRCGQPEKSRDPEPAVAAAGGSGGGVGGDSHACVHWGKGSGTAGSGSSNPQQGVLSVSDQADLVQRLMVMQEQQQQQQQQHAMLPPHTMSPAQAAQHVAMAAAAAAAAQSMRHSEQQQQQQRRYRSQSASPANEDATAAAVAEADLVNAAVNVGLQKVASGLSLDQQNPGSTAAPAAGVDPALMSRFLQTHSAEQQQQQQQQQQSFDPHTFWMSKHYGSGSHSHSDKHQQQQQQPPGVSIYSFDATPHHYQQQQQGSVGLQPSKRVKSTSSLGAAAAPESTLVQQQQQQQQYWWRDARSTFGDIDFPEVLDQSFDTTQQQLHETRQGVAAGQAAAAAAWQSGPSAAAGRRHKAQQQQQQQRHRRTRSSSKRAAQQAEEHEAASLGLAGFHGAFRVPSLPRPRSSVQRSNRVNTRTHTTATATQETNGYSAHQQQHRHLHHHQQQQQCSSVDLPGSSNVSYSVGAQLSVAGPAAAGGAARAQGHGDVSTLSDVDQPGDDDVSPAVKIMTGGDDEDVHHHHGHHDGYQNGSRYDGDHMEREHPRFMTGEGHEAVQQQGNMQQETKQEKDAADVLLALLDSVR